MAVPSWLAWNVPETGFPWEGAAEDKLAYALQFAVLAPSGHNTQPWLFRVEGNRALIFADRTRALSVIDPDDRELTMSCGAAAFHLYVTLRHFGFGATVDLVPEPGDADLMAVVTLGEPGQPSPEHQTLFEAIPWRHTNRMPFARRPIPDDIILELEKAAAAHGAWLHPFQTEGQRAAIADLVTVGDRVQLSDPQFRRELAAWIHPLHNHTHDGIPEYAGGLEDLMKGAPPGILRTFNAGNGHAAKDRELAVGSPLLAAIGTEGDSVLDWLVAGQALDHILLRACADGISASHLNQPIEVRDLRPALTDLTGREGYPQLLLRLGYGPTPPPTPRRPVKAVLLHS